MITPRLRRNIIRRLARRFDVRILTTKSLVYEASCSIEDRLIELNPISFTTVGRLVGAILHEVAHLYMWDMGIFHVFHRPVALEYQSIRDLKTYIATAYRAERKAEELARAWLKELYPEQTYWYAYGRSGREKKWVNTVYLAEARKILRKKQLKAIDKEKRREQGK